MDQELIASILHKKGLFDNGNIEFEPLKGGVSSDIYKVSDGTHIYVIKQALRKLKVQSEWYAEISRNRIEQDFVQFMQSCIPDSVPELIYRDQKHFFFVMEYLDSGYQNWKEQLLNGDMDRNTAKKAASLLADIHIQSHNKDDLKQKFDHTANFYTLRIEPYLVATSSKHPDLKHHFLNEAKRLGHHHEALVHGDFSPKNIMIKGDKLIVLDHEVAWYGDPAFDVAFLLNHLNLKMLFHFFRNRKLNDLPQIAYLAYIHKLESEKQFALEQRIGRLMLMLMLARIDGKSPVEYLGDNEGGFVRSFVYELLPAGIFSPTEINRCWKEKLKSITF